MPLLSGRRSAGGPVPFRNKKPDGSDEMLSGDIDILFPENLRAPISVGPEASPVTSQQSSLSSFPSPASAPPSSSSNPAYSVKINPERKETMG